MAYFSKQKQIKKVQQKRENLQQTINLTLAACHELILIATSTTLISFVAFAIFNN